MHSRIGENKPWNEAELRLTLDELLDGLREVNLTLVRIDASLREHMRRTELAEQRIEMLSAELVPLKNFVTVCTVIFKTAVAVGAAAIAALGAVVTVKTLLGH